MKFRLYVEGATESLALGKFFKRWLDPQLDQKAAITTVSFAGCNRLWQDASKMAQMELSEQNDIRIISILDIASELPYPTDLKTSEQRGSWGKQFLEGEVNNSRYRHFFACHELEAWLLSQPSIFPSAVRAEIMNLKRLPEKINHDKPPSKLLNELYRLRTGKNYKKRVDGSQLFAKLDPKIAYAICPSLKAILDEMLLMAADPAY